MAENGKEYGSYFWGGIYSIMTLHAAVAVALAVKAVPAFALTTAFAGPFAIAAACVALTAYCAYSVVKEFSGANELARDIEKENIAKAVEKSRTPGLEPQAGKSFDQSPEYQDNVRKDGQAWTNITAAKPQYAGKA
jgi:hypothetical protein